jgi:PKD repeat protein
VYTVALTVSGPGGTDTETKVDYITVYTPVIADFSATPTSGTVSLQVSFSNLSSGDFTSCEWIFGDGATSTDCNDPSHTYVSPGIYTVALTASGPGGADTETKVDYISAYGPVMAYFSATPTSGPASLQVSFTNLSLGTFTNCDWEFGDGATSTECDNLDHTYTSAGVYTVALTVSGPEGTDTETKVDYITVYTPVIADFSATPTSGAASLQVSFSNLSSGDFTSCAWDFGDGGTSTDCNNPSHTYASAGIYTIALTVSGPGGAETETKSNYIEVWYGVYLPILLKK